MGQTNSLLGLDPTLNKTLSHKSGRKLLTAVRNRDHAAAVAILQQNPQLSLYTCTFFGQTAWHIAASLGNHELLQELLDAAVKTTARRPASRQNPARYCSNRQDWWGSTPLMLACTGGHARCVKFLLQNGADAATGDKKSSRTALHFAAREGHNDCVKAVLGHVLTTGGPENAKALVNTTSSEGLTPLHESAWGGHVRISQHLLNAGSSVTAATTSYCNDGIVAARASTPLHMAARRGHWQVIAVVLKHHVESRLSEIQSESVRRQRQHDPRRLRDAEGRIAFQLAINGGHFTAASLLLPSVPLSNVYDAIFGQLARQRGNAAQPSPRQKELTIILDKLVAARPRELRPQLPNSFTAAELLKLTEEAAEKLPVKKLGHFHPAHNLSQTQRKSSRAGMDNPLPGGLAMLDTEVVLDASCSMMADCSSSSGDDAEVLDKLDDEEEGDCNVCMEATADVQLVPCHHKLCWSCTRNVVKHARVEEPACPFCRAPMTAFQDLLAGASPADIGIQVKA